MTPQPSLAPTTTRLRLDRNTVLHCASDQSIQPLAVNPRTWADPSAVPALSDGRILSVFDYSSHWTWWERHPTGDEYVHVLVGVVILHLEDVGGPRAVELRSGTGLVVPRGAWHRADIMARATMMFLTPAPASTEHRDA